MNKIAVLTSEGQLKNLESIFKKDNDIVVDENVVDFTGATFKRELFIRDPSDPYEARPPEYCADLLPVSPFFKFFL